ncbi:hypothetical protein HYQ46_012580 [Verticillium longisporum]|nr:hypothetical protein HYQ46_012580 [Verticillium longisporum]
MHTYGACYLGIGLSYQSQQPIDECHEDATTLYSSHAHVPAESSSAACISRQKAIQLASSPRAPTSTLTDYLGNVGTRRRLCKCRTSMCVWNLPWMPSRGLATSICRDPSRS